MAHKLLAWRRVTSSKPGYRVGSFVFWLALLCVLAAVLRGVPAVRYVNATATGSNDGSSWANAYTDLQAALTAAVSGDEIWVAAGTYRPTATATRSFSFALKNGVGVYGGGFW